MSTLIERMILRTQAPLSSLEPIAPVRYTPITSGQPPDEASFTEAPSAAAEVPDHAFPPSPRRTISQNALPGEGQRSASPAPPGTASPDSITPADAQTASARLVGRAESVQDQETQRHERRPAARDRPGDNSDLHATATTGRTVSAQPIPATARLRPADTAGDGSATGPPPVAGNASDEGGRGTDITVTIGHIEVRAAPAAPARPARPPFRPQVSLADFLKNNNGQGSRR
jgi:hypothetical protein